MQNTCFALISFVRIRRMNQTMPRKAANTHARPRKRISLSANFRGSIRSLPNLIIQSENSTSSRISRAQSRAFWNHVLFSGHSPGNHMTTNMATRRCKVDSSKMKSELSLHNRLSKWEEQYVRLCGNLSRDRRILVCRRDTVYGYVSVAYCWL